MFGQNFFGWPLGADDSSYDPSQFATKVRSVAVWFENYAGKGMANTPRVYLVPVGADVLRAPDGNDFSERQWRVIDQKIPVPLPIGEQEMRNPNWIPQFDSLGGNFVEIRRHSSLRAHHFASLDAGQFNTDSRLIGRSAWNTEWILIIPGGTLLNDANEGLNRFIASVSDIKLFFETYSYSGN